MRLGVLGSLAVWTDRGEPVRVPGLKVRALLADLLVHDGHPVSVDRLVDDLWGDAAPANPTAALQVRVSQLRRAFEDAEPGGRELVAASAPGYLLRVEPDAVDASRFAALLDQARTTRQPRAKASLLSDALALWRGPAFADFADEEFTRPAIARLEEQRLAALEERAEARLELGEHNALAGELGDLVDRHPLRERLRAVHMRALYQAGRQSEALDSYAGLRHQLAEELGLDPSPELSALHQAILEQDPGLAAAPSPAVGRPTTNLPASLTELIGRDEAVTQVRSLLAAERLVTLTGAGGVGKTRLAFEAARGVIDRFADGVWLVELAGTADDLADLVMAQLEIRATPGTGSHTRDRLAEVLRNQELLLVLDNCEHLVEQVAELAELLLQAADGVRILATSREPLCLAGETCWEVPPLEVPAQEVPAQEESDRHGGPDPQRLARSSAVQLFVTRAAAAGGFTLDIHNGLAVAQLCRRLDGIPLALELAATRVRTLGVHELVARLDDRFRLLTTGYRGAPARQRTLTAVIDWSWQLLTEPERQVMRRLALHFEGCTLEAAEAVCAGDQVAAGDVLDLVARLVDRSLVVMDDRAGDGPRYRLLESVSAFCIDRMREAGELAQMRRRHAVHYLDLAQRAEPNLYGHGQRRWLNRLDTEAANLRGALDTLVRDSAAERALRLVGALAWYWYLRGRTTEGRRSLTMALALPGDAPAAVRAKALAWLAGIAALHGDADVWKDRHHEALCLYEDAADPAGHARAEWFLGFAMLSLGELASSEDLVHRAMATFRELGDRWGEAAALTTTATLAHVRGDSDVLERDARRSAEIFGELGDQWGMLRATNWLIGLADLTGDYEQAAQLSRDGLRMAEELGLWPDAAERLSWLGWIALEIGDYAHARTCCEQALRLATEQGFPPTEAFARIGLAFAARRDGKLDLAEESLRHLLELARRQESESGHALYQSMVLVELGYLTELRGDARTALALHMEGFDIAREQEAARDAAWALEGVAGALALDGRHDRAAHLLGAAATAWESADLPRPPIDADDIGRITASVRSALGEGGFAAAFERGARLTLDEARALLGD
jgi:predicted ATPase